MAMPLVLNVVIEGRVGELNFCFDELALVGKIRILLWISRRFLGLSVVLVQVKTDGCEKLYW